MQTSNSTLVFHLYTSIHKLCMLLMTLLLAISAATASEPRPSPHELAVIARTLGPRAWHHELEFVDNPLLRARPEQVVILHLEPEEKNSKRRHNSIPYHFTDSGTYKFCVPQGDPHIRSLRLYQEGSRRPLVHVSHKTPCKELSVAAGFYRLEVTHEGSDIFAEGKKAFIHVPRSKSLLGSGQTPFPAPCDPNPLKNPVYVFTTPDGRYVTPDPHGFPRNSDGSVNVSTVPGAPGQQLVRGFTLCVPAGQPSDMVVLFNSLGTQTYGWTFVIFGGEVILENSTGAPFQLTNLGNGQFTLSLSIPGVFTTPVGLRSGNVLGAGDPVVFTIVAKYYSNGIFNAQQPPPRPGPGEISLFGGCNYQADLGVIGFTRSVPDLGVWFAAPLSAASAQLGADTGLLIYPNTNFNGTPTGTNADIPCIVPTPGLQSSFRIEPPDKTFVVATNACENCNLSGLDLSHLNLSRGRFAGSTFTGADLTSTNFESAHLDHANLDGSHTNLQQTRFALSELHCTNFSGANLSTAIMRDGDSGLPPNVQTDFSCSLDLSDATLNFGTFAREQWRFFNLNNATINGLDPGKVISTLTQPLNLSGALLHGVNFQSAVLDGANMGNVPGAVRHDGTPVATELIGATFTGASMRRINLRGARLDGANLNQANLEYGKLCGAHLEHHPVTQVRATLEQALLKNANLGGAFLTGASLQNANLYSTSGGGSCSGDCTTDQNCARLTDAALNRTDFTGAYLARLDLSGDGTRGQATIFNDAILVEANFTNAHFTNDPITGGATFSGAYLQGADFSNADVPTASFNQAYVDIDSGTNGGFFFLRLDPKNTAFTGYQKSPGSDVGCLLMSYSRETKPPATDKDNTCPNGAPGGTAGCTDQQWRSPSVPPPNTFCTPDTNWGMN